MIIDDNGKATRNDVNYKVGQPMGMYSSWPTLALTNHVLVRISAVMVGIEKFKDYFVLGDDIVIFNSEVADKYLDNCHKLGIKTKAVDSIHPKPTHTLEVAKRLFRNGVEVSPLPFRLFKTNFGLFCLTCIDRGFVSYVVQLYPGNLKNKVSMTAAVLLTL